MATVTFELDFTAEASVVTAADKLTAIRRLCESRMVEGSDSIPDYGLVDADTVWPSEVLKLLDGDAEAMRVWSTPSTDGTTEHTEITER